MPYTSYLIIVKISMRFFKDWCILLKKKELVECLSVRITNINIPAYTRVVFQRNI